MALNVARWNPVSQDYWKRLAERGITGQAARVRLARRLSDIVYAMLRDGRPYSVEYYLTHQKSAA